MSESNSENKNTNGPDGSTANGAAAQAQKPSEQKPSEIETLKAEVEKFKNEYLYLRAEFENYRRNVVKERSDLMKYGSERLLVDILGVLDNFERALESKPTPENLANYIKGVEMTQQELKNVLTKFGVTEIPAQGVQFDPNFHEALSSEETDKVKPGFISRVFKKPYKLFDKIIRPGQVIVAKEPVSN